MAAVGVLALQGAFAAHAASLERIGHHSHLVRSPEDLTALDGLILPGLLDRGHMQKAAELVIRSANPAR